jgi:DNA-binding response OmpR family regulator
VAEEILIVVDDDRIRAMMRLALVEEGYSVSEAASGEEAIALVAQRAPELVVVDLMLGGMDGFAVIRELRRSLDIPVIVVSARADTHDIVAALEAGADDYVRKPFHIKEVTARLRALRRRAAKSEVGASAEAVDRVLLHRGGDGDLVLSPSAGTLHRGDDEIHLTLTEFRLLCELANSPRQVLSRATLLDRVWDHGFFGDERLVDVHVRRLRLKVEPDAARPQVVVTVRGLGYRLDPP